MAKVTGSKVELPDKSAKCIVGSMTVGDILQVARVSTWQPTPHTGVNVADGFTHGYQRLEQTGHINRMVRCLLNGGYLYGCLTFNVRLEDLAKMTVNSNGATFDAGTILWLIDGQQRVAAIRKYYNSLDHNEKKRFAKQSLAVQVYYDNSGEAFEGRAFLLLNMAKAVRFDLRERLAQCWDMEDRKRMVRGEIPGISADMGRQLVGEARGCDIIDAFRLSDSFLFPFIRLPHGSNNTVPLQQHSFVRSIVEANLYRCEMFGDPLNTPATHQANILTIFWTAIRQIWPQPFEEQGRSSNQRKYALVTARAFIAMHMLLADILRCWEGEFTVERLLPIISRAAHTGRLDMRWYEQTHSGPKIGNGVEFWLSQNPITKYQGNKGVINKIHNQLLDAIADGSTLEAIVKQYTCQHNTRRGKRVKAA